MTVFCWLPPESSLVFCAGIADLDLQLGDHGIGQVAAPIARDEAQPPAQAMENRQRDILLDREVAAKAVGVAILRQIGDPDLAGEIDAAGMQRPAVDRNPAAGRRPLSDDRLGELGFARAGKAGKADPFAGANANRDVLEPIRRARRNRRRGRSDANPAPSDALVLARDGAGRRGRSAGPRRRIRRPSRRPACLGRDRRPPPRRPAGRRASPPPARRSRRSPADGAR